MEKYKYPRTRHLPSSPGATSDDKFISDFSGFKGKKVVITEKMDGENCLDEDTLITTNIGKLTIKEIVDKKLDVQVLTMNEFGDLEYKHIINYFMFENNNDWYEIETESGIIIKITGDHPVYLPEHNCYRKVKYLTENDKILLEK